jgi:PAS domain S-box-containing protein
MPRSGKNNERIEQVPRGRKKLTKIEPLRPQAEHPDKLYNDLAKFSTENPYPVLRIHRDGTVLYANKASEGLLKAKDSAVGKPAPQEWRRLVKEVLVSGCVARDEVRDNGRVFVFRVVPITGSDYVNFYGVDITEQKKAEKSLKESETRFRELFNNMSSGVAIYEAVDDGSDFVFRDFNAAGQRIDKTSKENVVGKRATQVFPGVKTIGLLDVFRRVWQTGKAERHPMTFYKDGRISGWRENYIYKLPNGEIVAVYDDVTKRQLAQEYLQEERNLLRTLIDHIPDKVYVKDRGSRFIACNKSVIASEGVKREEELIGKTDFDLYKQALAQQFFDKEQELMRTGRPIIDCEIQASDGNVRSMLVTKVPLRDHSGNIVGMVGINRDITERRLAENRLQQERNLLRTLIDHIPEGIYVKDKDGRFLACNKSLAEFWEVRGKDDIIGKTDFDLFEPARAQHYFDEEQKVIQTGQPIINQESQCTDKSGNANFLLVTKVPLRDSAGNITGLVGIHRDITERKQAEHKLLEHQNHLKQLATRLTLTEERERRHIASEIHDEISQTLAMVKIKLDTLRSSPPSEVSAAEIEEISSSVENVIQKTRTLTFELSNPLLYVLGLEAAVAEWLSEQVQEKHGIATEFQDDGKAKPLDDDVKMMLFRNVRELRINCIKHSNAGKVRVGIRRTNGSIEVVVEDNGVGFDPAEVRSTVGKRAKFGLFSIRESLENLGGHFEIESKPGAGCKAIMTAPLKDQSHKKEL